MTAKNIKLILSDWDGVLCDSLPVFWQLYKKHVLDISLRDFREFVSEKLAEEPILPGKLSRYTKDLGNSAVFKNTKNILKVLSALKTKNIKSILVTTSKKAIVQNVMAENNLSNPFEEIFDSNFAFQKPSKKLLQLIKGKYKVNDPEILFIGDDANDILFIKNTSVNNIFSTYGFSEKQKLIDLLISNNISDYRLVSSSRDLLKIIKLLMT